MIERISLNGSGWLFKGYYGEDWRWRLAVQPGSRDFIRGWMPAVVPGCVLSDLLQNGEIPDPHFERNSLLSEWVCQRTWLYRRTFTPELALKGRRARLVFKGVDYEMEVFLNGESLGTHTGMYTQAVFEVSDLLKFGMENLLVVVVAQPPQEQPQVSRSGLVRTHKARMNYWWDFCPRLVHAGLWDEVNLEVSGQAVLEDVYIRPVLDEAMKQAEVLVTCRVNALQAVDGEIEVVFSLEGGEVARGSLQCAILEGGSEQKLSITIEQPCLWWTNGNGVQPIYKARVILRIAIDNLWGVSDQREVNFGVRRLRAVANSGGPADALPYTLEVNGQRIFVRGWNWVPMDALYGVERPDKLRRLISLVKDANVNLLRVWGGGLIEKEAFYNLCDEQGIMVWQEFIQSSSGIDNNPPEDAEFIGFLVNEAKQIVPARRNHPSLAIWCGGNELTRGEKPLDDRHPMLAALKAVVRAEAPDCIWLPTSSSGPVFGNGLEEIDKRPNDLHDVHGPWEYQGLEKQYQLYNRGTSLFHSEFGAEGVTNYRSLERSIALEHRFPVNRDNPVWFHLGAWWVKEAMWHSVFGEFADLEQAIRATQFLQYEGLRYAVEADRRRWPRNSGTIPWQFNESFPMAACSSAVDYYSEPKPVYYAVRAAYRRVHVSARYERLAWGGQERFKADLWITCDGQELPLEGRLTWAVQQMDGAVVEQGESPVHLTHEPSSSVTSASCSLVEIKSPLFFLTVRLSNASGQQVGYNRYLFASGENMAAIFELQKAVVEIKKEQQIGEDWVSVHNPSDRTAFFIWLERDGEPSEHEFASFTENYFCLLPGETQELEVHFSGPRIPYRVGGWNVENKSIR